MPPSEEIVGVGIVFSDEAEGHVIGQLVPGSGAAACGQVKVRAHNCLMCREGRVDR